jgi:hypothetical protein
MDTQRPGLSAEQLQALIDRYDQPELIVSEAYADSPIDRVWSSFWGGAINQAEGGDAMPARYAIWANTVRDSIIEGMKAMEAGEAEDGRAFLTRAANSLSAFADVQACLDPMKLGKRP